MATPKQLGEAATKIQEAYHGVSADVQGNLLEVRDPSGTEQGGVHTLPDTGSHLLTYAEAQHHFPAAYLPPEETP